MEDQWGRVGVRVLKNRWAGLARVTGRGAGRRKANRRAVDVEAAVAAAWWMVRSGLLRSGGWRLV